MNICSICCDNEISLSFTCPYCKFESCDTCIRKFIEERPREPLCMNCGKIFSREFVLKNISDKKWFFQHIGSYTLEKEKMMLPETQEEVSILCKIKKLSDKIKELPTNAQITRMYKKFGTKVLNEALQEKSSIRDAAFKAMNVLKEQTITYGNKKFVVSKKKFHYIFKCPRDDCRGFISDTYICGTCNESVCKFCNLQIDNDHNCNKDDIKSAALVCSLTKPCPKCMTPILKSGGCDQMFCTQCNTPFSWITGEIEIGIIHNPHYYEYLATLSGTVMDIDVVACGEIPIAWVFMEIINRATTIPYILEKLRNLHRDVTHLREVVLPEWLIDKVKDNIDIRVQYLLNEIDESTCKLKLMNREKRRMKTKAVYDLLHLVLTIMEDFVRQVFVFNISEYHKWHDNADNIIEQISSLQKYYYNTLDQIYFIHGGKIPISLEKIFYKPFLFQ